MTRKPELGYTILELIVVFAIIAILSTIAIAAFVNYGKAQSLQTSASELTSMLNLARSRSLSQIKPSQCPTSPDPTQNQNLKGYQVVITTVSNKYRLDAVCSGSLVVGVEKPLPVNITFDSSIGTSVVFLFPVLVNGVKVTIDDSLIAPTPLTTTITLKGYDGQTKDVKVDSGGGIR